MSTTSTTRRKKPHLSVSSYALLARIDEYIVQYDLMGSRLSDAAPDVLDGLVNRIDVEELVRKKVLSIVRYEPINRDAQSTFDSDCGKRWTAVLTQHAISKLWPGRAHETSRTKNHKTSTRAK